MTHITKKFFRGILGKLTSENANLTENKVSSTFSKVMPLGFSKGFWETEAAAANLCTTVGSFFRISLQQTSVSGELHSKLPVRFISSKSVDEKAQLEAGLQIPSSPVFWMTHFSWFSGGSSAESSKSEFCWKSDDSAVLGPWLFSAPGQLEEQWPQCPPPTMWKFVPGYT